MDEMHSFYDDIPDYELGKCANCQNPIEVKGERNPHNAICANCERNIHSYDLEQQRMERFNSFSELRFDEASGEYKGY